MSDIILLRAPELPVELNLENEWLERKHKILETSKKIEKVDSQDDYDDADVSLSRITKISNGAEKKRKDFIKPYTDFTKQIKTMADDARSELESEKSRIKGLMKDFVIKKQKEEEEEIEKQADILSKSSFAEHAETTVSVESGKVHGSMSSIRKEWTFEIVDESQMPREYLIPDEKKIREYVKANKNMASIPGVKIFEDTRVQSR